MHEIDEIKTRLDAVERRLSQTVRMGIVDEVIPEEGAVRVVIPDDDCMKSAKLSVLQKKTLFDKAWWMPDVGEHVVCVFLPYAIETGFVIGAFYSDMDPPPVTDPEKARLHFKDGGWCEYNRAAGKLTLCAPTAIELMSETVVVSAQTIKMPIPIPHLGGPDVQPVEAVAVNPCG